MLYPVLLLYAIAASGAQYDQQYQQQHTPSFSQPGEQGHPQSSPLPRKKQNETKPEVKTALCAIKGILQPTPIALNATCFVDLVINGNMFIDKTMLIKDLFDYGPLVKIIARPKGWGKTVNLNMVKTFYELEADEETGDAIGYRELTPNYDLFYHGQVQTEDGNVKKIMTPLLIAKHHDFMEKHQGQHAVVYLNFDDFEPESYNEFKDGLRSRLKDVYLTFKYMPKVLEGVMADPTVDDLEKKFAERHLRIFNNVINGTLEEDEIKGCLKSLCELLTWHFGTKPLILIEEYDTPLLKVLLAITRVKKDRILNFFKSFINVTFGENVHLEKALLTGTMRLLDDDMPLLMYDANEDVFFTEYQGFSSKEVEWLFDYLEVPEKIRIKARAHYGGYNFDLIEKTNFSRSSSIAKFLTSEQVEEYFETTSRLDTLILSFSKNMEFLQTLHGFVCGCSTVIRLNWDVLHFQFEDIKQLLILPNYNKVWYKPFSDEYKIIQSIIYTVIKLLCATGYLTLQTRDRNEVTIKVPNEEVRILQKARLLNCYASRMQLNYNPSIEIQSLNALSDMFEEFLCSKENYTTDLVNAFDTFLHENLPAFQEIRCVPKTPERKGTLIHALLNFITLYIDRFRLIHAETYLMDDDTQAISNVVLIHNSGVHGVIIAFGMGNRPLKFIELLTAPRMDLFYTPNKHIIKTVKHVVAHISRTACFQISAKWSEYQNVRIAGN